MRRIPASVDVSFVRMANQQRILEKIDECEPISRSALAQALSMSKPAVSDNVAGLIEIGIVEEVGEGLVAPSGGRKPILLRINRNHKYIIAVDLDTESPVFMMCNLKLEIIRELSIKISSSGSAESQIMVLENGIRLLLGSSGHDVSDVLCVAVASPGVYNEQSELISYNARNEGAFCSQLNIRASLEERLGIPVIVKNAIKASALGEWVMSGKERVDNMIYVSCGLGLGAGIILDGQLYEGKHFNVGEIFNYSDREKMGRGMTLENTICIQSLIERVSREMNEGAESSLRLKKGNIGFEDIVKAYQERDSYVCSVIREIADELSILILNCAILLAPENVVLGGDYTVFSEMILDQLEKKCKILDQIPPKLTLPIGRNYSGVFGMAYLAKQRYFDSICQPAFH